MPAANAFKRCGVQGIVLKTPNTVLIVILAASLLLNLAALFWIRIKKQSWLEWTRASRDASKKHEEEIQTASAVKNRMLSVLESMTEGVVVIDTDKKILLMNSMLAGVLEINPQMVRGSYFWEAFRDPDINDMIQESLDKQRSIRKEHKILLFDTHFQIQVSPVFSDKLFLGVIAVFHDVTRLKKLEEMRSEFVANVSHELKTPLTSILGYVETLKEGALEDKENSGRFLSIIDDHAKKLHGLIEDLLLLSSVESGRAEIRKETLDLGVLLDRMEPSFAKRLKEKQIVLVRKFGDHEAHFPSDAKQIEHALSNLLDNAIKYNTTGGKILVGIEKKSGTVNITVTDTGIGIPEADLNRIFERFYRVDKSRSRELGGSGLGLSIAKHIVERHNGRIEVRSRLGAGSTFSIILPVD